MAGFSRRFGGGVAWLATVLIASAATAQTAPKTEKSEKAAKAPKAQTTQPSQKSPFVFRDVTQESGLLPSIGGLLAHGAGWGDADNDGFIDLYVGTFHQAGGTANKFYRNTGGKFILDDQQDLQISTRANSGLFVDFNNDGWNELYVTSMPNTRDGIINVGPTLFRNDGKAKFTNISQGNGACPPEMAARSAAAVDFDGDGLLDLIVVEDKTYAKGHPATSRLFKNLGNLQFKDVTQEAGIPTGLAGYGVAAADANNDTWPDFFISGSWGTRLFLNDGKGKFREARELADLFDARKLGGGVPCGVAFGDVNRDGLLDIVIGQHFDTPWQRPIPIELFLNRGIKNGAPQYQRVTEKAGLVPLTLKAPHVEIQDFDNDGWPDIYGSMMKWAADGSPHPVIFRNLGPASAGPQFREYTLAVNDYPTEEKTMKGASAPIYAKIERDHKVFYGAPGPTGDYDNDGRLDIFIGSYWLAIPSMLLKNETPGGHWVRVKVEGSDGVNRQGIGSRVAIYQAGHAGAAAALLGVQDISAGYGYASSQVPQAHFGLGDATECDIIVTLPHKQGEIVQKNVKAGQVVTLKR